jgi:hypothetical protein
VLVRGYAEITDDLVPYVFVILTEVSSPSFALYLEQMHGNAFADSDRIGVGCLQNRDIYAIRSTDYGDLEASQLPQSVTQAILISRQQEPVTLHLTASGLHAAGIAPDCFSHFAQISLEG